MGNSSLGIAPKPFKWQLGYVNLLRGLICWNAKMKVRDAAGNSVHGYIVPTEETTKRFSDVKLQYGSVLKIKSSALEAIRMQEQWDDEEFTGCHTT